MATTRALSVEDKDLSNISLSAQRDRYYSDIDLTFSARPSGDVYKKTDAAAVKQAVKNLLTTNLLEKPFDPNYGANLTAMLFELANDEVEDEVKDRIISVINTYEPRAKIVDLQVTSQEHDLNVYLEFRVENTGETVNFTTTLSRLR